MVVTAFDDSVKARGYPDDHFQVFAINGLSWPHTESLIYSLGDTVTWRVINATDHGHPMHLHGFHYTVEARGYELGDTTFAPADRRLAVTEFLRTAATMRVSWIASRPGNWLFHCHLIQHIATSLRLVTCAGRRVARSGAGRDVGAGHGNPCAGHCAAAILGERERARRRMQLFVREAQLRPAGRRRSSSSDSARRPGALSCCSSAAGGHRGHQPRATSDRRALARARAGTATTTASPVERDRHDGRADHRSGDSFIARITPPRAEHSCITRVDD
jgi:hypothetical protein